MKHRRDPGEPKPLHPIDPSDSGDIAPGHFESVVEQYLPPGATYRISRRGHEIVTIDPTIPYPDSRALSGPVRELLLDEEVLPSDLRTFRLPSNTILLGLALNEASSSIAASTERKLRHQTEQPLELLLRTFGAIFTQIGETLKQGYSLNGLDYKQVVVKKDDLKIKLLPPLEVHRLTAGVNIVGEELRLATSFVESLRRGLVTPSDYFLYSKLEPELDNIIRQALKETRK